MALGQRELSLSLLLWFDFIRCTASFSTGYSWVHIFEIPHNKMDLVGSQPWQSRPWESDESLKSFCYQTNPLHTAELRVMKVSWYNWWWGDQNLKKAGTVKLPSEHAGAFMFPLWRLCSQGHEGQKQEGKESRWRWAVGVFTLWITALQHLGQGRAPSGVSYNLSVGGGASALDLSQTFGWLTWMYQNPWNPMSSVHHSRHFACMETLYLWFIYPFIIIDIKYLSNEHFFNIQYNHINTKIHVFKLVKHICRTNLWVCHSQ